MEEFGYKNAMQVPRLDKIVLNMGVGEATADTKKVAVGGGRSGADRRPEAGHDPGAQVDRHLQGARGHADRRQGHAAQDRMYEFLDRLVTIALPRVRDFRGLNPKTFDGRGNYAMGIKEHIVFPEINYDKVDQVWGMDIIVCTTAKTDDEAKALLQALQFPVPAVRARLSNADTGDRTPWRRQAQSRRTSARKKLVASNARPSARAEGDRRRQVAAAGGALRRRASSSRSCRATPSPTRIRNRCEVTGRPRAYYRKLKMSRIALRELGSKGQIPGMVKSSW